MPGGFGLCFVGILSIALQPVCLCVYVYSRHSTAVTFVRVCCRCKSLMYTQQARWLHRQRTLLCSTRVCIEDSRSSLVGTPIASPPIQYTYTRCTSHSIAHSTAHRIADVEWFVTVCIACFYSLCSNVNECASNGTHVVRIISSTTKNNNRKRKQTIFLFTEKVRKRKHKDTHSETLKTPHNTNIHTTKTHSSLWHTSAKFMFFSNFLFGDVYSVLRFIFLNVFLS